MNWPFRKWIHHGLGVLAGCVLLGGMVRAVQVHEKGLGTPDENGVTPEISSRGFPVNRVQGTRSISPNSSQRRWEFPEEGEETEPSGEVASLSNSSWENPESGGEGWEKAGAMLRTDPVAALEVVRAWPSTERRDEFLDQAVAEWSGLDGAAAVGWVRQIEHPPLRNRLMGRVAVGMATELPDAAARLVANEMEAGGEQDRAVVAIVQRWVRSDASGAAAWVARFPPTPMRRAAVEALVGAWWNSDSDGVRVWFRGLPEGRLQQQVSAAIRRVDRSTP